MLFDCNIWPNFRVFGIQRQPFLKPGFAISLDSIDGAFRFANATVDAFVGMDNEHVLALVEAVHRAHLDAVHGFAANAAIVDDVGQLGVLPADCRGQLMCAIVVLARPLFGGDFSSMAQPPFRQDRDRSLSPWPPAFSLLLADDENSLHQLKTDSE